MRKKLFVAMMVALTMATGSLFASNVTLEKVREAGAHFMTYNSHHDVVAEDLMLIHEIENPALDEPAVYFFNVSDFGFIIMSATTAAEPVLGFSDEGNLDPDNLAPNMMAYIENMAEMIFDMQINDNDEPTDSKKEWELLLNKGLTINTKDEQVILMSSYWDQGSTSNPTVNMYCPKVGNRYSVTGCVATAAAQICYYYQFPKHPKGTSEGMQVWRYVWSNGGDTMLRIDFDTVYFDYSLMVDRIKSNTSLESKKAMSLLCYALGMATNMNYSPEASGAFSAQVSLQMQQYFRYTKSNMITRSKVTSQQFVDTIRRQLLRARPLYMSGSSSGGGVHAGGHAWVCDGYQKNNNTHYHMNWGWGYPGGSGFFNLYVNENMNPSGYGYNFKNGQQVIINMVPSSADSTAIDFTTFEGDDFVGIRTIEENVEVAAAYPNPAISEVFIPYSTTNNSEINIYSIDGKTIEQKTIYAGTGELRIDVSKYNAGMYIYRVGGKSGKFIVQ